MFWKSHPSLPNRKLGHGKATYTQEKQRIHEINSRVSQGYPEHYRVVKLENKTSGPHFIWKISSI